MSSVIALRVPTLRQNAYPLVKDALAGRRCRGTPDAPRRCMTWQEAHPRREAPF